MVPPDTSITPRSIAGVFGVDRAFGGAVGWHYRRSARLLLVSRPTLLPLGGIGLIGPCLGSRRSGIRCRVRTFGLPVMPSVRQRSLNRWLRNVASPLVGNEMPPSTPPNKGCRYTQHATHKGWRYTRASGNAFFNRLLKVP